MSAYPWTSKKEFDEVGVALAQRVEKWGKKLAPLGVAHFYIDSIHITDETPGGPRAKATVQASQNYDHCTFWFQDDFLTHCSGDELDHTIIHEWLHVAMRDFDRSLDAVEKWMPEATYGDFEDTVDAEREGLVDRVAHTLFLAFNDRKPHFTP